MSDVAAAQIAIHGFEIEHYRTFERIELTDLRSINVLCGPNNAGKSSVLDSLQIYADAVDVLEGAGKTYSEPGSITSETTIRIAIPRANVLRMWEQHLDVADEDRRAVVELLDDLLSDVTHEDAVWMAFGPVATQFQYDFTRWQQPLAEGLRARIGALSDERRAIVVRAVGAMGDHLDNPTLFLRTQGLLPRVTMLRLGDVRRLAEAPLTADDLWRLAQAAHPLAGGGRREQWAYVLGDILRDVFGSDVEYQVDPLDKSGDFRLAIDGQRDIQLAWVGAGIREVVAIAFKVLTAETHPVLCIEEPENSLHPTAVRRLIDSLSIRTRAQMFVTTHSAGVVNTDPACLIHVRREAARSTVETVSGGASRYAAVRAMGYRPSDLVLTPCAVWVEGPSDREYLRTWLRHAHGLEDGDQFHIMFTAGSLATHLTVDAEPLAEQMHVAIRSLSRRCVVVADRDRDDEATPLKDHVERFRTALHNDPQGHFVLTWGREVENYLDPNVVDEVRAQKSEGPLDRTDLRFRRVIGSGSKFEKLDFARRYLKVTTAVPPDAVAHVQEIAGFIKASPDVD